MHANGKKTNLRVAAKQHGSGDGIVHLLLGHYSIW